MRGRWKRVAVGIAVVIGLVVAGGGAYVAAQTSAFDESMMRVYAVAPPAVERSTDPTVLARGKHVAESLAGCTSRLCHASDLGGGEPVAMGPVGTLTGPNISQGGLGAAYTDGELARLIQHGVKKDGRSLRFMPVQDFNWIPDGDVAALVSYLRTVPATDRANGVMQIKPLGKVLDRKGLLVLDVARKVDHEHPIRAAPRAPTAEYGAFVARLCSGCHGEHLSGGPIPGAPPSMATPLNLTPDATGLQGWSYDDFARLLDTGIRKNGRKLDAIMPLDAVSKFDDVERHALWMYLATLPPTPFGQR